MAKKANSGSFKQGDRRAGRPKGTPNKTTADVRAVIAQLAQGNVHRVQDWLDRVARKNPAKAADLFIRLLEYHLPRLARTEVSGLDGAPIQVQRCELTDEQLLAIAAGGTD